MELKDARLLVVDDDPDFREAIAHSFRRKGCVVLTASNGREAYDITQREHLDAIISDIRMPGGDGVEFLDRVRESSPDMPIILLITGYAEIDAETILNKGAEALISKPFHPRVLQDALTRLMTPAKDRWGRANERVDVDLKVEIKLEGLDKAIEAKVLSFGRGGFFIELPPEQCPQVQSTASFKITFNSANDFEGAGVVRWARIKHTENFPSGCGIEFTYLGTKELEWVTQFIDSQRIRPYIPNR